MGINADYLSSNATLKDDTNDIVAEFGIHSRCSKRDWALTYSSHIVAF